MWYHPGAIPVASGFRVYHNILDKIEHKLMFKQPSLQVMLKGWRR